MVKISIAVRSNKFPTLAQRLPSQTAEVVKDALDRVVAGCQRRSRVDEGDMRDAWRAEMTGPADGRVVNDNDHVLFNEYGTAHMSAQPMLAPSIDEERPKFVAEMAKLVSELG